MAGKHSKSVLDVVADLLKFKTSSKKTEKNETSLPFKIVTIALVFSLIISLIFVAGFFSAGTKHKSIINDAKNCFDEYGGNKAVEILSQKNSDVKGWINIDGTDISYVVCQSDDDKYYTNHNQLGKKSRYGALSLSSTDTFERDDNDSNIVIFGNNMKDGTMFGSLKKYRNINFYKQNPTIELYYGNTKESYVIFSVMLVSSYKDDAGSIYNPSKSHFADKKEFDLWYQESQARSLINTKISAKETDKFLTLVTLTDDFEGARLVVLAKKITKSNDNFDTSKAVVNGKIKYPKIWYTKNGLEYPYE